MANPVASIKNMTLQVQLTEDSEPITVHTATPDYVAFDITRGKQKWPGPAEAPFLWSVFLAWHAMRRQGLIPSTTAWESFCSSTFNVDPEEELEAVDPTRPTPVTA